jgi:hypothetical protein
MPDKVGRYKDMGEYPQRTPSLSDLKSGAGKEPPPRSGGPLSDDERKSGPPVKPIQQRPSLDALGPANISGWPRTSPSWPWKGSR